MPSLDIRVCKAQPAREREEEREREEGKKEKTICDKVNTCPRYKRAITAAAVGRETVRTVKEQRNDKEKERGSDGKREQEADLGELIATP
jgi:hypothetical protein